ncbi:MAG: hypothetical protein FWD78_08535 [Treponema sp.]|nr:hypothetical protein [Treponema sp.]
MLASLIKQKALQTGFLACGIIPAETCTEFKNYLDERIRTFPQSKEFYQSMFAMAEPPEGAKSIIVCTLRYNQYKEPQSLKGRVGKFYQFDNRLTYTQEYRQKNEFETYLKTLGINLLKNNVSARWAAAKAGLGKFGYNNFIFSREHGSWIRIETWAADTVMDYDRADGDLVLPGCSDNCRKCIDCCPTKALSDKFSMDRGKCIAHLGFRGNNGAGEEAAALKFAGQSQQWIYGCDICQDVCPVNKNRFTEQNDFPLLAEFEKFMEPEKILEMDDNTYINIVNPRFWYIGPQNIWKWKCIAIRCLVNSGDSKYHMLLKKYCDHEDARIRETAVWGCQKLGI